MQKNQERADQIHKNADELKSQLDEFAHMTDDQLRAAGYTVGERVGQELAQVYAIQKIATGAAKTIKKVNNTIKNAHEARIKNVSKAPQTEASQAASSSQSSSSPAASSSGQTQQAKASTSHTPIEKEGTFKPAVEESAKRTGQIVLKNEKVVVNDVISSKRVGSALKKDTHHAFNDIIDNYASYAQEFTLKGNDGKMRRLFQIEGSLNGTDGIFEWIVEPQNKFVTHRLFIKNGTITGKPNMFGKG